MKYFIWLFLILLGLCLLALGGMMTLYRSSNASSLVTEQRRKTFDAMQNQWFIKRAPWFRVINAWYGNGDKYVFRPPRIVPSYHEDGSVQGYTVYGMVTTWSPGDRIVELSSYLGEPMFVRFDPETDGSLAVMPKLNRQGVAESISEQDFVERTSDPEYETLFCEGDVLSIESPTVQEFTRSLLRSPWANSRFS